MPDANNREADPTAGRLVSLDAYRGSIMLLLVAGPLVAGVTSRFPESPFFVWFSGQFAHVPWAGLALWDLVAPAFIFMIGVSLPFSCASRVARGEPAFRTALHVLKRSLVFLLLGLLLASKGYSETRFTFTNLLCQVALAYPFAYLTVGRGRRIQAVAILTILLGWWLAFVLYPLAPTSFDYASVGVPENVEPFAGFFGHWSRGFNVAAAFDLWFLNLLPRPEAFLFHEDGAQTLSFIGKIATMAIGVMAGEMLASGAAKSAKRNRLFGSGFALLLLGLGLGLTLCPVVKLLWTPSYVLVSSGLVVLGMAVFYVGVEIGGLGRFVFPAVVVGTNSIVIYLMNSLIYGWLTEVASIHLTRSWALGQVFAIGTLWLICLWLYRRKIFLRV